MKNKLVYIIIAMALAFVGCKAYVEIDKRASIALPIYDKGNTSNVVDYVIVDQGYEVKYSKWGFNTEIQSMTAELTTNKTVKFSLGGFNSTLVTNSIHFNLDDLPKVLKMLRESNVTNEVSTIE